MPCVPQARAGNDGRGAVAVMVCGPSSLVDVTTEAAHALRMDVHTETFLL